MNYKDYMAKKQAIEDERDAAAPTLEAIRKREALLANAMQRTWSLGAARFSDTGEPSRDLVEVRLSPHMGISPEIRLVGAGHDRGLPSYEMLSLSPDQWRMVADIVGFIDTWRGGYVDDLPPSGAWPAKAVR